MGTPTLDQEASVSPATDWLERCAPSDPVWYAAIMLKGQSFPIDLADPDALRSSLIEVEREVVDRRVQMAKLREELNYWETLYRRLNALVNPDGAQRGPGGETTRERILRIVNESELPVDVDAVLQLLPSAKRKTVSWNLWDLEQKGKIQRVGKLYARLDFEPATTLLNGSSGAPG